MFAGTGLHLLFAAILSGQAPTKAPVEPVVLERFKIAKGGDLILVPVTLAGRQRMFVLDTGSSQTIVDRALLHGNPISKVGFDAADKEIVGSAFPAPSASVGSLGFKGIDVVLGMDMAPLREASGLPIEGILGMDFLSGHVIRIDFDNGELLFLTAAERDCATAIPLTDDKDAEGCQCIRGSVGDLPGITFRIDSGCVTASCGSLDTTTYDVLKNGDGLKVIGQGGGRGLAGDFSFECGQTGVFQVRGLRVEQPLWASGNQSILGLGFLSRFRVTFDFPKKVMYLRPGANSDKPDLWDKSGVGVLAKNGKPVVGWVCADSPGEKAGVKPGDVLLRVGGVQAGTGSLFELRNALCGRSQIPIEVRRATQELTFTLNVEH
jgi:PDZ domain/Aspartyl protease